MFKINKSVEIITTSITSLSSMSLASRLGAKEALEHRYKEVRITDIRTVSDLDAVIARRPDLAFLGVKFIYDTSGPQPKKVWVSEQLGAADIAYTGSDETASKLEYNKSLAKQVVRSHGIATAESILIREGEQCGEQEITMRYPLFVKPVDGGGGSGINEHSLVRTFDELTAQVTWLHENCQTDALIETYLPGREFSIGILKRQLSDGYHLMPLEIIAPSNQDGSRYLSSRVKSADAERTTEVTDRTLRDSITRLALGAFQALGARGYGRIDIRLDAEGRPHFLEANLLPSLLNNYGNLPKAAKMNLGLTHQQLLCRIAELGTMQRIQHAQLAPEVTTHV